MILTAVSDIFSPLLCRFKRVKEEREEGDHQSHDRDWTCHRRAAAVRQLRDRRTEISVAILYAPSPVTELVAHHFPLFG